MKIHKDGTMEGTPEELARYQAERDRLTGTRPATPDPWRWPTPLPTPQVPTPGIPWQQDLCRTCSAQRSHGESALCHCVIPSHGQVTS